MLGYMFSFTLKVTNCVGNLNLNQIMVSWYNINQLRLIYIWPIRTPTKIQELLQYKNAWWDYYQNYKYTIRTEVVETIVKMLSCGIRARGFHHYSCSNPKCLHSKNVTHSCSCRYCQTCGVKPTNDWINDRAIAWNSITNLNVIIVHIYLHE